MSTEQHNQLVKNIANSKVFAGSAGGGVSYRQWLVGQILSGAFSVGTSDTVSLVNYAINLADDTIERLADDLLDELT